jgi:hypothetical protein
MLKVGTYNAIISPNDFYSPENSDFASSHKTFKRMMPTFAWEVLEVYSGPPVVAFKWRHWGTMKNDYAGFNELVAPQGAVAYADNDLAKEKRSQQKLTEDSSRSTASAWLKLMTNFAFRAWRHGSIQWKCSVKSHQMVSSTEPSTSRSLAKT